MLVTTDVADTPQGTNGTLEIQIVSEGRLVSLFEIRDTFQDDLEAGQANFYSAPVIVPFTKGSLDDTSITLRLRGRGPYVAQTGLFDGWLPASFFLFGLDDAAGRPESIVPLVHLPEWPHGIMQPDATSATASVTLSLAPEPFLAPEGELVATLNSIATGQKKIIELLEKLVAK
jgi:hypothetical protein